jgi:hypothetical protein
MRTIRASEIGAYIYCHRAWWYQQKGEPSANQAELAGGAAIHEKHGKAVVATGCLRTLAVIILLAALALAVYSLTIKLL